MVRKIPKLMVVDQPIDQIVPFARNPREHPEREIEMLVASIKKNGFVNPVLLSDSRVIIAGHGRLIAAKRLLMTTVPAIILGHLTEAEQRALRVADNQIALRAVWSVELLAEELQFVMDCDIEPIEIGFETGEIDFLIGSTEAKNEAPETVPEPDRSGPAVSMVGDIWAIGAHRIGCGNSLDLALMKKLMNGKLADAVVTDMPFNVRISGHVGGKGKIKHREFPEGSGELSIEQFGDMIAGAFTVQAACAKPGALIHQFIDWRSECLMRAAGEKIFGPLLNMCVWVKPTPSLGSLYRSRHELILVFRNGGMKHTNNVMLGKFGRNRSNVWEYPAPNAFGSERKSLALHPTAKNQKMIEDAILDGTNRREIVLDPFLGSGTTALAAHKVGRVCYAVDLDPGYVDLAINRLSDLVGLPPTLEDGRTFDEVKSDRAHGGVR